MSFLTDQNLTFHRFSDGTISSINQQPKTPQFLDKEIKRKMSDSSNYLPAPHNQPEIWTTSTKFDYSSNVDNLDETVGSKRKMLQSTPSTASEFKYLPSTPGGKSTMARSVSTNYTGGSTMKLISITKDDQKNKQVRIIWTFDAFLIISNCCLTCMNDVILLQPPKIINMFKFV